MRPGFHSSAGRGPLLMRSLAALYGHTSHTHTGRLAQRAEPYGGSRPLAMSPRRPFCQTSPDVNGVTAVSDKKCEGQTRIRWLASRACSDLTASTTRRSPGHLSSHLLVISGPILPPRRAAQCPPLDQYGAPAVAAGARSAGRAAKRSSIGREHHPDRASFGVDGAAQPRGGQSSGRGEPRKPPRPFS